MICGSLMAVANGLIPSLGAMIYGNLTDELVIRKSWNCTLSESVTTAILRNVVTLEMIQPRMKGINVMQTRSIEVTVNKTGIRVTVVGMNGKEQSERMYENMTTVRLKGTALNETELVGIDVRGSSVEMLQLKNKSVDEKEGDMNDGKRSGKGRHGNGGDNKTSNNERQIIGREAERSQTNGAKFQVYGEGFGKHLERSVRKDFMENVFFENSRKRRHLGFQSLFGDESGTKVLNSKFASLKAPLLGRRYKNSRNIGNSMSERKPELHRTSKGASEGQNTKKIPANASDDGVKVGTAQSISSLIPVTPKPPPPTHNVSYTLRNITEICLSVENRVEENMRKYALYYVYAAIATLLFAYGQMVMWNIASERGVRNLSENLTDSVMDKDPGFYDTKIYEGVVNLAGIT